MPEPLVSLTRRATFAAAHRLYDPALDDETNLRIFGKCANPRGHGHNYTLEVTVRGPIAPATGMVMDLVQLKQCMEEHVLDHVDHKHLNEDVNFLRGLNPTVENLVVAFWRQLERGLPSGLLYEVRLEETENNWASYRGD
jgi:6-pyruvoyltetrahydropterin/6-carboxytetrahydropterin synthase